MDDGNPLMQGMDIAIEDSLIVSIGKGLVFHDARVIDAKGKLVMPGLINGHCHVPMTLLRNYADDMDLQTWLFKHIFPAEDRLAGEDVRIGSLIGIMEMLATGTTCFADMYYFMDDIAEAVAASGIRAQLSRGQTCSDSGDDFSHQKAMGEAIDFVKKWNGAANGRITAAMDPMPSIPAPPTISGLLPGRLRSWRFPFISMLMKQGLT
jgi:5-methylthioadenosine/S-adenosylhomocysteine deaminase